MRSLRSFALLLGLYAACHDTKSAILDSPPVVSDSTLGVGDTFEVRVYGEPDLSTIYRVGAGGTITFPLVGVIAVEGLDAQAAAKKIEERLRDGILRNPQVSVLVKDQTSKKIVVMGQVSKPGTYGYVPSMTILEIITMAGGFTAVSAKNDTTITRIDHGKKETVRVPVAAISEGKAQNVFVRPGDIISVPERIF